MTVPARRDLVARRDCPFAETWPFTDRETGDPIDLSTATVSLEIRLYGAQAGPALVTLAEVGSAQTEGLYVVGGEVTPWIEEATLRLLPDGKPGQDVAFRYDLKVQPAGEVPQVYAQGVFLLKPWITDRLNMLATEAGDLLATETGAYLLAE
jgi:hypothetical protein